MKQPSASIIKITRWTARALSLMTIVFHLLSFLGDRWSTPLAGRDIVHLILWGIILVGMILAWKWERVGSLIIVGGFIIQASVNPVILLMWAMWVAPITGVLFFISSLQIRENVGLNI